MKSVLFVTILLTALLFNSCEPAATFDKPQPDNAKSLSSFPKGLQGKYLAADHASIMTIANEFIIRHYDFDYKEHKDSLGSFYKLAGDTLIDLTDGTKEKVIVNGDTIIQHVNWVDTLFNLSADNVLKKLKGYLFLNNQYGESSWEVRKISLTKGILTVGNVSDIDDIQKLKKITETTSDTTSTNFSLTRRQFKKFVQQNGFGDQETFIRIN